MQWPQPFSCEQVSFPGETSLQALPLLLLEAGELGVLLLLAGEDGAGPSYALTCRHDSSRHQGLVQYVHWAASAQVRCISHDVLVMQLCNEHDVKSTACREVCMQ